MEVRVKEEASLVILCASSVSVRSMVAMSFTLICLESITPVTYAKGDCNFIMNLIGLVMTSFDSIWSSIAG